MTSQRWARNQAADRPGVVGETDALEATAEIGKGMNNSTERSHFHNNAKHVTTMVYVVFL